MEEFKSQMKHRIQENVSLLRGTVKLEAGTQGGDSSLYAKQEGGSSNLGMSGDYIKLERPDNDIVN